MQKHSDLSGFLEKSTGAPHGDQDGCITPVSNNSSNFFFTRNCFWGLYLYIVFCTGLAPSTRGISCMSPCFQLGGARVGNVPGNTSQHLHNTVYNDALLFLSTLASVESLLLEDPYLHTIYLIEIT